MRIGILTLHNAHNCGAALQCFALQEYLRAQGHEVKIIDYRIPNIERLYRLKPQVLVADKAAARLSRGKIGNALLSGYLRRHAAEVSAVRKYDAFTQFRSSLNLTERCDDNKSLRRVCEGFDALIAGSDQVWNPEVTGGFRPAFFLPFGRKDAVRLSYAASIGAAEIAPEKRELYRFWLRKLDAVSLREASGCAQIAPLTDKPVTEVLDPVFLLPDERFRELEIPFASARPYLYVHNVHLTKVDGRLDAVTEAVSARLGLDVVSNRADSRYTRQTGVCAGGPREFLGCLRGAAFVVTNSFHATAFSVLYRKRFATVPNARSPERMLQLLSKFELRGHAVESPEELPADLDGWAPDPAALDETLREERGKSLRFLEQALAAPHRLDERSFLQTGDEYRCFGCGACAAACAAGAIDMRPDEAGFLYPQVDRARCVDCGRCAEVCFYGKLRAPSRAPQIYAARHRDPGEVKTSNSGAAFPALAAEITRRGGKVIGVRFDEQMRAVYSLAEGDGAWRSFKGSKYVAADNRGILALAEATLRSGAPLLFCGTPCQIAGLYAYLGREHENLYTVNILCMGVGSPEVFRQYKEHISSVFDSELTSFSFRSGFRGQKEHYVELGFASGASLLEKAVENGYQDLYRQYRILRPSCYDCPFRPAGNGKASLPAGDISLGDFWRIEETHPAFAAGGDASLLQVNTDKGRELLDSVRGSMELLESREENGYRIYTRVLPPFSPAAAAMRYALKKGEKLYE